MRVVASQDAATHFHTLQRLRAGIQPVNERPSRVAGPLDGVRKWRQDAHL
jgi:hypothetical protein